MFDYNKDLNKKKKEKSLNILNHSHDDEDNHEDSGIDHVNPCTDDQNNIDSHSQSQNILSPNVNDTLSQIKSETNDCNFKVNQDNGEVDDKIDLKDKNNQQGEVQIDD